MPEAVIVAAARTPIGHAVKGSLAGARPDDLLAFAIAQVLARVPELDPVEIVDVTVGCAFPEQKQGMNIARRAALLAGLPDTVPGTTVNRFCASGLQAIRMAFHTVRAGEGDAFVAAGIESVSQVNAAPRDPGEWHPRLSGDDAPIANVYIPMGLTAERVAEQWDVSREDMDLFAQRSQERAVAAQDSGFFARDHRLGGSRERRRAAPRVDPREARLARAGVQAWREGDSRERVPPQRRCRCGRCPERRSRTGDRRAAARARIIASAVSAVAPEIMGVGPIEAVRRALSRAGMTIDDIDVMELNEAFAAQVLPVCRELGVDPFGEKLNPHGGAIALGHPFGMTGTRIMGTLLNDLETLDKTVGLETMCVGGGQGMAMIVQREG